MDALLASPGCGSTNGDSCPASPAASACSPASGCKGPGTGRLDGPGDAAARGLPGSWRSALEGCCHTAFSVGWEWLANWVLTTLPAAAAAGQHWR
jgi:hypothetical protein